MTFAPSSSLCWDCQNSVPSLDGKRGCSWSRRFEPVDDWKARKVHYSNSGETNRQKDSWIVKECPEFLADEPLPEFKPLPVIVEETPTYTRKVSFNRWESIQNRAEKFDKLKRMILAAPAIIEKNHDPYAVKTCVYCGQPFSGAKKFAYCSTKCMSYFNNKRRTYENELKMMKPTVCRGCGKKFKPIAPDQKWCSQYCCIDEVSRRMAANARDYYRRKKRGEINEKG